MAAAAPAGGSGSGGISMALIAGAAGGGATGLAVIGGVVYWRVRRRRIQQGRNVYAETGEVSARRPSTAPPPTRTVDVLQVGACYVDAWQGCDCAMSSSMPCTVARLMARVYTHVPCALQPFQLTTCTACPIRDISC